MKRSTLGSMILAVCVASATSEAQAPSNDECANAIVLSAGVNPASGFFTNVGATNSAGFGDPCQFGNIGFADVFFAYTPSCSTTLTISTCTPPGKPPGTNGDTHLDVYLASACGAPPSSSIACNDDFGCGLPGLQGYLSQVTFPAVGGQTYLIRVANFDYGAPDPVYHPGTFYVTVTPQTAAKAQIGPGCADGGAGGGPVLDISAPPVLGSTRTLTLTGGAPNAPGLLLFSPPGPTAPITGGCTLYVTQATMSIFLFVATDAAGNWSSQGTVPANPTLECSKLRLQAILLPLNGIPFYQSSSGLEVTLGY